jgi:hypothetical protein
MKKDAGAHRKVSALRAVFETSGSNVSAGRADSAQGHDLAGHPAAPRLLKPRTSPPSPAERPAASGRAASAAAVAEMQQMSPTHGVRAEPGAAAVGSEPVMDVKGGDVGEDAEGGRLRNSEGNAVVLGKHPSCRGRYYCGQRRPIPDSDGFCGEIQNDVCTHAHCKKQYTHEYKHIYIVCMHA